VGAKWNEVVKGPGVFNGRNAIGFLPDAQYIIVSGVLRWRFDAKSEFSAGGHAVCSPSRCMLYLPQNVSDSQRLSLSCRLLAQLRRAKDLLRRAKNALSAFFARRNKCRLLFMSKTRIWRGSDPARERASREEGYFCCAAAASRLLLRPR